MTEPQAVQRFTIHECALPAFVYTQSRTYVYICMHIYIYTRVLIYAGVNRQLNEYDCVHICIHTFSFIRFYVHVHIYVYAYTHIDTRKHGTSLPLCRRCLPHAFAMVPIGAAACHSCLAFQVCQTLHPQNFLYMFVFFLQTILFHFSPAHVATAYTKSLVRQFY